MPLIDRSIITGRVCVWGGGLKISGRVDSKSCFTPTKR